MQQPYDQSPNITLSVVMPNYNQALYITKALQCIIQQTVPALEIIVIDDCSTDDSNRIIQQFANSNPLIRVIQQQVNKGIIYNLNFGLQVAKGMLIYFAGSDDWVEPTLFAKAIASFTNNPNAGFFSAHAWSIKENQTNSLRPMRMPFPAFQDTYFTPQQAHALLLKLDSWFIGTTTVLHREHAIAAGGFLPELASFCDNFLCRVLAVRHGCSFSPVKLATWRLRTNGFANSCNVDFLQQSKQLEFAKQLLETRYAQDFSLQLKARMRARFAFNISRTKIPKKSSLRIIKLLLLFMRLRWFDLALQIRISLNRYIWTSFTV